MSTPLEDYALLSDLHTGPLLSRNGSIDWLCLPRFDSSAVFSAILGTPTTAAGDWMQSTARWRTGVIVRGHLWWIPPGEPRPAGSG
ncbi:MAG: trehalase-like domain-containing protein [Propionibacteriaceae bacterium]